MRGSVAQGGGSAVIDSPLAETGLQAVLRECVAALARVDGIFEHGSDVQYGLMNYIARYSLGAESYLVSSGGAAIIASRTRPYRRAWLDKREATFEHLVPAAVVRSLIRDSDRSDRAVEEILIATAGVAIVSKEEDRRLTALGLGQKMPPGWTLVGGSRAARYEMAGIPLMEVVPVTGVLIR
jgi:hypothetical protein